jgi:hypothetical protein
MATRMWRVDGSRLLPLESARLEKERRLEEWLEADPSLLGMDLLIIGRQVCTDHGGYIDLLAMDEDGDLAILELKRDRTPREIVAQVLDYASWVAELPPRRVHEIADSYLASRRKDRLKDAFREKFGRALPETLNSTHSALVVASEFDESSKRIVEYLARRHGLEINTAFFRFFRDGEKEYLTADWLMDQEEVRERSDAKTKAPWSGVWYVNVASGADRSWEDARKFGFYAYQKGNGYVGVGTVTAPATPARNFAIDGKPIKDLPLAQPAILERQDDEELTEHMVGIRWERTVPSSEAKTFTGVFANQNIVCKLRDEQTLEFLRREFGA